MQRRELARYHDVAATTKVRGAGIGFARVGVLGAQSAKTDHPVGARGIVHTVSQWLEQLGLAQYAEAPEARHRRVPL